MASLSLCPQFETNPMLNRRLIDIELLLQLKSAKAHGKSYMKVKPHLVCHLLRNCLLYKIYQSHQSTACSSLGKVNDKHTRTTATSTASFSEAVLQIWYSLCEQEFGT